MYCNWCHRFGWNCYVHLHSSTLKMKVARHTETPAPIYKTTWCHIPKDSNRRFGRTSSYHLHSSTRQKDAAFCFETLVPASDLHCLTSHKTVIFLATAVISSYLTHISTCTKLTLVQYFLSLAAVWSGLLCLYNHGFIALSSNLWQAKPSSIWHLEHKQVQNHHDIPRSMTSA
jgi:hypothetical protein